MQSGNCKSSFTLQRGIAVLCAALALGFGPRPADAAPFVYVANSGSNNVSVIDTAQYSGGHGRGEPPTGDDVIRRGRHPGREFRLCDKFRLQQCFGDRCREQQSGGHGRGGGVVVAHRA
jgi:hypothetical protein